MEAAVGHSVENGTRSYRNAQSLLVRCQSQTLELLL